MKFPRFSFLIFLSISLSIVARSWSSLIINPTKVKQISWKPRAFVYKGFLTDEECSHLISLAKSELKRSAVADNLSGESKLSEVRTSSGMFIPKGKDPIVAGIEEKIATWTFLPKGVIHVKPSFSSGNSSFTFSVNTLPPEILGAVHFKDAATLHKNLFPLVK